MFTEYSYEIEGPAVAIRGTLHVELDYTAGYSCGSFYLEPSVDVVRAVADSGEIVDDKGRIVGRVELLTDEQRALWGATVLADCQEAIEAACIAAVCARPTRDEYESARADMAHSDGERDFPW
jgi:hypothetical protein